MREWQSLMQEDHHEALQRELGIEIAKDDEDEEDEHPGVRPPTSGDALSNEGLKMVLLKVTMLMAVRKGLLNLGSKARVCLAITQTSIMCMAKSMLCRPLCMGGPDTVHVPLQRSCQTMCRQWHRRRRPSQPSP
jgi:hypothetical protein